MHSFQRFQEIFGSKERSNLIYQQFFYSLSQKSQKMQPSLATDNNISSSNYLHDPDSVAQAEAHTEAHLSNGDLLKSIIYGGVDATVNTAIIILSGVSSNTPSESIFAIVIAAIVAGALDMAFCDYVSAKAEMSYVESERQREFYQIQNCLQQQKQQIVDLYLKKGYEIQDCVRLSELYSTNSNAFANVMMLEELSLVTITDQNFPIKCGVATFVSFLLFGLITFSPYIVDKIFRLESAQLWTFVIIISSIQLISLGFAKSVILGISKFRSITEILIMGSIVVGVGFGIGQLFPADQ